MRSNNLKNKKVMVIKRNSKITDLMITIIINIIHNITTIIISKTPGTMTIITTSSTIMTMTIGKGTMIIIEGAIRISSNNNHFKTLIITQITIITSPGIIFSSKQSSLKSSRNSRSMRVMLRGSKSCQASRCLLWTMTRIRLRVLVMRRKINLYNLKIVGNWSQSC